MSGHSPSSRIALRSVVLAAVVLLGASCTGRPTTPTDYGDTTQENFMAGCVYDPSDPPKDGFDEGLAGASGEDACQCVYDAIVETIPFDEFKAVNEQLSEDPGPLPDSWQALVDDCTKGRDIVSGGTDDGSEGVTTTTDGN